MGWGCFETQNEKQIRAKASRFSAREGENRLRKEKRTDEKDPRSPGSNLYVRWEDGEIHWKGNARDRGNWCVQDTVLDCFLNEAARDLAVCYSCHDCPGKAISPGAQAPAIPRYSQHPTSTRVVWGERVRRQKGSGE